MSMIPLNDQKVVACKWPEPCGFGMGTIAVMKTAYESFLREKSPAVRPSGLSKIPPLHPAMTGDHQHQHDVCQWALRLGKAAAFLGTGMGKTLIELEWARVLSGHTGKPILLLAPLAVAQQTVREGEKFGIESAYYPGATDDMRGIVVSNYERLERFDPAAFSGIVLDESSILKAFDGKTRTMIIESFRHTPYRLAATATPAPNDYMELGNHAEFLGVMTRAEMLAMFFVHDGGETQKWRLKGHAKSEFWKWVCSWAVSLRKPSDLGYDDGGFVLPPLEISEHLVDVDTPASGMLFAMPAQTLSERLTARRDSVTERVDACARAVMAEPLNSWVIWCNLNTEAEALANAIPGAVNLTGSDSPEEKTAKMIGFADGKIQVLITKPSIAGFGLNWQHCARMAFVGLSDSWEQFYQAVRRCWRFGQTQPVKVLLFAATTEGAVLDNIKRKDREAEEMAEQMVANMQELTRMHLRGTDRNNAPYVRESVVRDDWTLHLADCVDVASELPSDSMHYSIYSPPFESLYTYSNSERDMGNARDSDEFWQHYRFLIAEQFRVMMPGRLVSIHCMNLPTSKVRDGIIGIRDFRGEIIRAFEDAGFIYHSEVCIWKDPVTAMQRTKALGLLHKTIRKDSSMSRQGVPDYLVTMRKPGDNPEPISHSHDEFPVTLWQRYASPVWMDINPSDTLQYRSAREHDDERHICPLQLTVVRRAMKLWSNEGDVVWSPFAGIGSEGFVAIEMGRKFLGSELKRSYFEQAVRNLELAGNENGSLF